MRTLYRWKENFDQHGLVGLVHKTRKDQGNVRLDRTVISEIETLVLQNRKMSIATTHRKISETCKKKKKIPCYSQVYKVIKRMDRSLIKLSHFGEKSYKEEYDIIYTRETNEPNQIWQADHTLLDIEVLDEKGQRNRPWLTVIMDDYSRAVAGYNLSFSAPNAARTAFTLHQAIWNKKQPEWPICGIPEIFYTDHGSDFTSIHMEQVAVDLRINLVYSTIGEPRGRGKIERFFRTVNQLLLEGLPGYIGNATHENLLSIQEFEEKLHHFLIMDYNHKNHSVTRDTPVSKWNNKNFLPNMPVSLEKLDLLLLELPKTRKVHSEGIHFQGLRYMNPNLGAYVGESVLIRYNPTDIAEIRVFYKGKFLCNCISPELSDYSVDIKELITARNKRKNLLKKKLQSPTAVDILIEEKQKEQVKTKTPKKSKLKRYYND